MSLHRTAVFLKPKRAGELASRQRNTTKAMSNTELEGLSIDERRRYEKQRRNEGKLTSFFVDHVSENYKKQDRTFTASIFEALLYRIRKLFPEAVEIVFCTDNAKNYNKNVLPIFLPFICDAYGFQLTNFLHPDA